MDEYEKRKILLKIDELEDKITGMEYVMKKNALSAGDNITINNGKISATVPTVDTSNLQAKLTAGNGITISDNTISANIDLSGKQDNLTAGDNITIHNNVISATASCQNNCANRLSNLETQISNIQSQFENLNLVFDPYYNPKEFTPIGANDVVQNSAFFEKYISDRYFGNIINTGEMVFSAKENSTGTLTVTLKIEATGNIRGTFVLYNNGTQIYSESVELLKENSPFTYIVEIPNITLYAGNIFTARININYQMVTTTTYYSAELTAPNAEVINQMSPYKVEYFDGKYYLSDCTSGTAKIGIIDVEDITSIRDVNWTDTGISCMQYGFGFNRIQSGQSFIPDKRVDYYYANNRTFTFQNMASNNEPVSTSSHVAYDWVPAVNEGVYFCAIANNLNSLYNRKFTTTFANEKTCAKNNSYNCCGVKLLTAPTRNTEIKVGVFSEVNGNNKIYPLNSNSYYSSAPDFSIGFGTRNHSYFKQITTTQWDMVCFSKYYDRIIKREFSYNTSTGYSLGQTQEVGAYEEYFEGANNDYFVVKNGKLKYYKKRTIAQ